MAFIGIMVGFVAVLLSWRSPFRSARGIAVCYLLLLGISQYYQVQRDLVLGLAVLASLVLFHNVLIHRRLAGNAPLDQLHLDLDLDDDDEIDPDLGNAASQER
jgi:hypothetical protein